MSGFCSGSAVLMRLHSKYGYMCGQHMLIRYRRGMVRAQEELYMQTCHSPSQVTRKQCRVRSCRMKMRPSSNLGNLQIGKANKRQTDLEDCIYVVHASPKIGILSTLVHLTLGSALFEPNIVRNNCKYLEDLQCP